MNFTKWFWIALALMIALAAVPTVQTWGAPAYDGQRVYGFPLTFYSWGGLCYSPDNGGAVCSSFSYINLIVDGLVLIGVPLIANLIILKIKK